MGVFDSWGGGGGGGGGGFTQRGVSEGALHRGGSWREEGDLQLPTTGKSFQPTSPGGASVAAGEAHSRCRGAGGVIVASY